MNKESYRLLLDDDVMAAVSLIALNQQQDASELVNQILADYLSTHSSGQQLQEIYNQLTGRFQAFGSFRVTTLPSRFLVQLKSPLQYQYRPTIRYSLKLFRNNDNYLGEMQVVFRTQHVDLLSRISSFLSLWMKIEAHYLPKIGYDTHVIYQMEEGYFSRRFLLPPEADQLDSKSLSFALADYIKLFDDSLKFYLYDPKVGDRHIEQRYIEYLNQSTLVI